MKTSFKYIKCCCTELGNNLFINIHKLQEMKVMSSYCRNVQLENSLGKAVGSPLLEIFKDWLYKCLSGML